MAIESPHGSGRSTVLIESYSFGRIVIDGKPYDQDVIVYPDCVQEGWVRKAGHRLDSDDLQRVLEQEARTLIVGTGKTGVMRVPVETLEQLESEGFEVIVQRTDEACETYNRLSARRPIIAALHLGC
jgi:hypothetical protein